MLEPRPKEKKVAMQERSTLDRTPVRARASDGTEIYNIMGGIPNRYEQTKENRIVQTCRDITSFTLYA
jgi:hypothetical protein